MSNDWYHATARYGDRRRHWWNRKRNEIIADVLLPFIGKQVQQTTRASTPTLFNFGAASYLTILRTHRKLKRSEDGTFPSELQNKAFVSKHNITDEFVNELRLLASADSARSLIERSLRPTSKQIFVIMKLDDPELDSAYKGVITPLGQQFGYKVIRIDDIKNSGNINDQILDSIAESRVILADLSGERPNCYYEAGFAHALGKEMIFASQKKYKIHFDLASYRFILWKTEAEYRQKLSEHLESIDAKDSD
jgi:hypothetical protein